MSNIYLKAIIAEENRCSQNFGFLNLRHLSLGHFWAGPTHVDIIEF